MNKREVVWLIVRLIGVYFAYLAIVSVFTLVGSVSTFYSLSSETSATPQINTRIEPAPFPNRAENEPKPPIKTDPVSEKAKSESLKTLLFNLFLTALYGGVAFYLIAKGKLLFSILNREDVTLRSKEPTVMTIKL